MSVPEALKEHVNAISPLSSSTWGLIEPLFRPRELAKHDHFARLGRVATEAGLLQRGYVRAYVSTEDGREYNKHLFVAPAVIGEYASLLTGEPVRIPQQALCDCVIHAADYRALMELTDREPELERWARRFAELQYLEKEQREIELVTLNATERYRRLTERLPTLERDIPHYHIASYLGITATQLSRIRAALRR